MGMTILRVLDKGYQDDDNDNDEEDGGRRRRLTA